MVGLLLHSSYCCFSREAELTNERGDELLNICEIFAISLRDRAASERARRRMSERASHASLLVVNLRARARWHNGLSGSARGSNGPVRVCVIETRVL